MCTQVAPAALQVRAAAHKVHAACCAAGTLLYSHTWSGSQPMAPPCCGQSCSASERKEEGRHCTGAAGAHWARSGTPGGRGGGTYRGVTPESSLVSCTLTWVGGARGAGNSTTQLKTMSCIPCGERSWEQQPLARKETDDRPCSCRASAHVSSRHAWTPSPVPFPTSPTCMARLGHRQGACSEQRRSQCCTPSGSGHLNPVEMQIHLP
jgi:hypothetical protein